MSSLHISFRKREDSRGSLKLEEERSIFGKIYDSVKEKKKSLDLSPSTQKIQEMLKYEEAKAKQMLSDKTSNEKNESNAPLNMSALRLLDAMYKQEDGKVSGSVPSHDNNVKNSRTVHRKDSLRSLPTYHSSDKVPAVKHKETSVRGLPFKRDNSMIEVLDEGKHSQRSFARSKRAVTSPKNAEVTRKHMEKLTRFEQARKVNLEKLQSKLSVPSTPIFVSSRLPSSLLPPLSLRGSAKAEASHPADRAVSPTPTLAPRSPRSPMRERPTPSLASSSASINENNNNMSTNHIHRIDTTTASTSNNATQNLRRSVNTNTNPAITITTTTDQYTLDNNKWFRPLTSPNPDSTRPSTNFTASQRSLRSRSYDGRQPISRELSVAGHRLVKDDLDL